MITRYTAPEDLISEFCKDRDRAWYWQKKMLKKEKYTSKSYESFRDTYCRKKGEARGEIFEYESPMYGNKWLLWWRFMTAGMTQLPECRNYQALYRMTADYMEVMIGTRIGDNENILKGVTVYTDHLFQRIAQRLKVDMTDRKKVICNFVELASTASVTIRPPRPGERDDQCICKLPASFLKGHILFTDTSYVMRYNTFIPEKSMTPAQMRWVKSFAKDADDTTIADVKNHFKVIEEYSNNELLDYGI